MKLTNKQVDSLIKDGFVKLPELKLTDDQVDFLSSFKFGKTYTEGSELNKEYLKTFDFNSLKDQLRHVALDRLNLRVEINDIYTVSRYLKSYDNLESYRGHFDSHVFTIVTPVLMPSAKSSESGQLIVFPKIRKEPKNELHNIFGKIWYKLFYNGRVGFEKLMKTKNFTQFNFNDNIPVLFLGRQCYHGNRAFDKAPNGERLTILTHLFDPNSKGIGSLLRKIRKR